MRHRSMQNGNLARNCPHPPPKGQLEQPQQEPQLKMITPAVQQVTTWSKAKQDLWVEQEAVWLQTKEWVEEANAKQAAEILVKAEAAAELSDLGGDTKS